MKNNPKYHKYLIAAAVIVISLFYILLQDQKSDIVFCREVFLRLTRGNLRVVNDIDWNNLQAFGIDVGKNYSSLLNEKQKRDYRAAYIKGISEGFSESKMKPGLFANWRFYDKGDKKTVIAVDNLRYNKTLLFTISKINKRKLIAVQWKGYE